jgi:uncharacterized protein YcbK (DUF882 family)
LRPRAQKRDVAEIVGSSGSVLDGPSLALLTLVILSPIVILLGMRISAMSTLVPAMDPWVQSTSIAASVAVQTLADGPIRAMQQPEEESGAPVTFYNVNTRESETFVLPFDGELSAEDKKRITHLFRCKRTGHERKPDVGLLKILAQVAVRYEGHVFEVVSAHRHNRGTSRTSKHRSGHAIDLRVRGVNIKEVRTFVWQMSESQPIGLGYYRGDQFLHIDFRPAEGRIAWDQRREGSADYRYHPKWAGGDPNKKDKKKAKAKSRPSRSKGLRSARPQV